MKTAWKTIDVDGVKVDVEVVTLEHRSNGFISNMYEMRPAKFNGYIYRYFYDARIKSWSGELLTFKGEDTGHSDCWYTRGEVEGCGAYQLLKKGA